MDIKTIIILVLNCILTIVYLVDYFSCSSNSEKDATGNEVMIIFGIFTLVNIFNSFITFSGCLAILVSLYIRSFGNLVNRYVPLYIVIVFIFIADIVELGIFKNLSFSNDLKQLMIAFPYLCYLMEFNFNIYVDKEE